MADYVKIFNDAGGIKGRKLRFVPEDTGYKVDVSVATFKKITSQNKVSLYYGDSTGFFQNHQPRAGPQRQHPDGRCLVRHRAEQPGRSTPTSSWWAPTTPRCSASCSSTLPKKSPVPKWPSCTRTPSSAATPLTPAEAEAKKLGLTVAVKLMTPPGSVDVSTEVIKLRRAAPDYTIFHGYILAPIPEFIHPGQANGHDQPSGWAPSGPWTAPPS